MPEGPESLAFYEALEADLASQSDRSLAILGFSFLDSMLRGLLEAWFIDAAKKAALFEGTGPLSTASAKIALAHATGLISDDERRDLDLLRKIRNKFAHEHAQGSFNTDPVRSQTLELQLGVRLFMPKVPLYRAADGKRYVVTELDAVPDLPVVELKLENSDVPRVRFAATVSAMTRVLAARWTVIADDRLKSPVEFQYAEGPYEVILAELEGLAARFGEQAEKAQTLDVELADSIRINAASLTPQIQLLRYGNEVLRRSRDVGAG